jgi:patatin-like phospholipase/acyl hydrolase
MDPEAPLRILSLDGGGIRGISSLYILKDLLAQIERDRKAEARNTELRPQVPPTPLRPCDIFDLICGTSTGGLIALMLGRLEMVGPYPSSSGNANE